jgi:hypothetical protein
MTPSFYLLFNTGTKYSATTPPPPSEQKNSKNCLNHTDCITKSVDKVLLLGVVQETSKEHIHNVLPLNVNVKKNNGKLRLILYVMFINQFMVVPTFKYPQLHKENREIFGNSLWTYGIDISQAFHHIEIDPNYRKYLGFSGMDNITHSCVCLSSQLLGHDYGIGSYVQL